MLFFENSLCYAARSAYDINKQMNLQGVAGFRCL